MPGHPRLVTPPAEYATWYAEVEACSGLKGDFARVRWYWYDDASGTVPTGGNGSAGKTWPSEHKIALGSSYWHFAKVVRHEALHDILGRDGHPPEYFGVNGPDYADGKCGALVSH